MSNRSVEVLINDLYPKLESCKIYIHHQNTECPIEKLLDSNRLCEKMKDFACVFDDGSKTTLKIPNEKYFPNLECLSTQTSSSPISFQNLVKLRVHCISILEKSNLPNLEELELRPRSLPLDEIIIPKSMNAPKLKFIYMKTLNGGLKNFDQFTNLEKLIIHSSSSLGKTPLTILENLPKLNDIRIYSYFGGNSFSKLSKQIKFTKLVIKPKYGYDEKPYLDMEDVKYISKLESLQYLELNVADQEQFDILINANLPNLTQLNFNNHLTSENIISILQSKFHKLKTLGITQADKPMMKLFKKYSLPNLDTVKFRKRRACTPFKALKPLLKSNYIRNIKYYCGKRDLLKLEKFCERNQRIKLELFSEATSVYPNFICKITKI
ncbi:predicted protein [Naegleria gruberi]|uniref:Predicted protein n=1 Tax=Naegleria gruberi TaxID=5762 RepID=D2W3S5_NAEGR|nr:uncharacterized protein NAEGRDRAFT_54479 [Naegleria gruberi]EFC36288.1 predicted protein [Naegleria gruberi]|eukprot:XP_002669032.1 predicted protein [Naegleria gruberi strain NEG-M]